MKYIIEIKAKNRWKKTWWTNECDEWIPNFTPVIPVTKAKAIRRLKVAQEKFPNAEYRIAEAK